MSDDKHIFSNGELKQDENTISFKPDSSGKVFLPIKKIDNLYFHGQVTYNTRVISFLCENGVTVHVFDWNGRYTGSFEPKKKRKSGNTVVKQIEAFNTPSERNSIGQEIIASSIHNMAKNLQYYEQRGKIDVKQNLGTIQQKVFQTTGFENLMGVEAEARKEYYSYFEDILGQSGFTFNKREYNPPSNKMNSLISYVNSLLYSTCTAEIYKTNLLPTIGYVHQPSERRNTLALDLADIFKPVIVDRLLFRLINRNQITPDDFDDEGEYPLLKEKARKTICKEYDDLLSETVEHPDLERHVSYKYLIRLEVYKIQKHIMNGEPYSGFKRWW